MPTYQPSKPSDTDFLAQSAGDIRGNFQQANTVYSTDHYAFDNVSSNLGFHNTVTTPLIVGAAHPATAANIPKMYAMQDLAALGVLQYSRGGNNAAPTPLTSLHGDIANLNGTQNILDLNGLSSVMIEAWGVGVSSGSTRGTVAAIMYDGSLQISNITNVNSNTGQVLFSVAGKVVTISATNATNVYWTLRFLRIVV